VKKSESSKNCSAKNDRQSQVGTGKSYMFIGNKVEMVGTEEPDLRLLKTNISPSHSFLTSFPLVRYR
jgi:hypothetical protein